MAKKRSEHIMESLRIPKPKGKERGKQAEVGFEERINDSRKGKADKLRRVRK